MQSPEMPKHGTSGLMAMTSASHAEGRQFDPGLVYFTLYYAAACIALAFAHALFSRLPIGRTSQSSEKCIPPVMIQARMETMTNVAA